MSIFTVRALTFFLILVLIGTVPTLILGMPLKELLIMPGFWVVSLLVAGVWSTLIARK